MVEHIKQFVSRLIHRMISLVWKTGTSVLGIGQEEDTLGAPQCLFKRNGYHYTSLANWERINKEGMIKPQKIISSSLLDVFRDGVDGIWLWKEEPKGESHAWNILFQLSTKADTRVVKLKVEYDEDLVLRPPEWGKLKMTHTGTIGDWEGPAEESVIYCGCIPLKDIKVVGIYDVVRGLERRIILPKSDRRYYLDKRKVKE